MISKKLEELIERSGSTAATVRGVLLNPKASTSWEGILALCEEHGITHSITKEDGEFHLRSGRVHIQESDGVFSSEARLLLILQDVYDLLIKHGAITH